MTQTKCGGIKQWENAINRHLFKEYIQMANKDMNIYSILLIIRQMHIKTKMRYHVTPVRMLINKKSIKNKCWKGCEVKGRFSH